MHRPMPPMHPPPVKARTITLTSDDIARTRLRTQRIEAADLPLFARHDITDWITVNAEGGLDVVVHVTRIAIPPELAHDTDAVLAQVAEAFAVRHLPAGAQGSVTVNFGPRAHAPSRPTIP